MANFIKVKLSTAAGAPLANQPEIVVDASSIITVIAGNAAGPGANPTTTTRILVNGGIANFQVLELTHTAALATGASIVEVINNALKANPGGIISTVSAPVNTAQVVTPANSGRQLITTAQVQVLFTAVAWS